MKQVSEFGEQCASDPIRGRLTAIEFDVRKLPKAAKTRMLSDFNEDSLPLKIAFRRGSD
jgi:hypothetical protein